MKFKQPKSVIPTLALVGGALVGAMGSRIGYGFLPTPESSTTEAMYKGGIAVAAGAGAVFVDGNDALANLVRGAFIGASVEQGLSLIKGLAQDANVESKIIKDAVGLACPCQDGGVYRPLPLGNPGRVIPLADRLRPTGDFGGSDSASDYYKSTANAQSLVFQTAI